MPCQEVGQTPVRDHHPYEIVILAGQLVRAGGGTDHQDLFFIDQREGRHGHGAGHVPDDGRHSLIDQLPIRLQCHFRILLVVLCDQFNRPSIYPTSLIDRFDRQDNPVSPLDPQVGKTPGQCTTKPTFKGAFFCSHPHGRTMAIIKTHA